VGAGKTHLYKAKKRNHSTSSCIQNDDSRETYIRVYILSEL